MPVTRGGDGGARNRPTFGEGGPGVPAGTRRHGVGSPYQAVSAGPLGTCWGRDPIVMEGRDEVIPRRAGGPPGGGSSYTCGARCPR